MRHRDHGKAVEPLLILDVEGTAGSKQQQVSPRCPSHPALDLTPRGISIWLPEVHKLILLDGSLDKPAGLLAARLRFAPSGVSRPRLSDQPATVSMRPASRFSCGLRFVAHECAGILKGQQRAFLPG